MTLGHSPRVEHVARAARVQLPSQATGMGVKRSRAAHGTESPDVAQQLVLGEHPPGLGGESAKKSELLVRQMDLALSHGDAPRHRIDAEFAEPDRPPAPTCAAAQYGGHPGEQLRIVKWL